MEKMAEFLQRDQSKFFENLSLEGERIGEMKRGIIEL